MTTIVMLDMHQHCLIAMDAGLVRQMLLYAPRRPMASIADDAAQAIGCPSRGCASEQGSDHALIK